jgi:hypothetical protein
MPGPAGSSKAAELELSTAAWTAVLARESRREGDGAMKFYVSLALAIWLICGLVGTWMLGVQHFDAARIAAGPITLIKGFEEPATE